jgi:NAD(P)H dehydrogenase (quinone)
MQHAVIIAHPKTRSLTHAAADAYAAEARELGRDVLIRDLYALDFDPRLRESELPSLSGVSPAPDIVAERQLLADVKVFVFVYPFWFNAPPAILKGYVDRVFGMGFGYGPAPGGGTEPLLDGRQLLSFSFSGAPEVWVNDTGALKSLMAIFDAHLARMCGLELLDHIHTGGIAPNMTEEAVDAVLDRVREATRTLFRPGGGSSALDLA